MRLRWTLKALADREEIFQYIEADNLDAALTPDERIWNAIVRLQ